MGIAFLLVGRGGIAAELPDPRPRVLAFASENWLSLAVGTFNPATGWIPITKGYTPPPPDALWTLFGNRGKLGEVREDEKRRADPSWTPLEWRASLKRGSTIEQPFALAMQGSWPETPADSQELSLTDPAALRVVSDFLKSHGLKVDSPHLTQAYQSDLAGDGQAAMLLCAHSDASALRSEDEAVVYALALLRAGPAGKEKTIALAGQWSFKPAGRKIKRHQKLYGTRDFYRFIAIHDIDGDGRKDLALYRAEEDATQIDVYTFDGRRVRNVLTAYKSNYN